MYATIFSIIIALFIGLNPFHTEVVPDSNVMGISLIIIASLFVIVETCALAMAWLPLQKAEMNFTPRILQVFRRDRQVRFIHFWMLFFPLITYAISIDLLYLNLFNRSIILAIWIVLLGISIDLLSQFLMRILSYLNPFSVIEIFKKEATFSIQKDQEIELCEWIDALGEIAIKAVQRSSQSLANHAIDQFPKIIEDYFNSAKSIGHKRADKTVYIAFYLLQRLEMIFHKAIEHRLEPVCGQIINETGKVAISSAKFDMSMTPNPIRFIGNFAHDALVGGMSDLGDYAACTLLEVANAVLTEIDVTYLELRETFFTMVSQLEEISRDTFRQNKDVSVKILNHPFEELRAKFDNEKMAKHPDTAVIVQDINRVIGEFDALGQVMRTVPPIPKEPSM